MGTGSSKQSMGGGGSKSSILKNNPALSEKINGVEISELVAPYIGKYKYVAIRTQEESFQLGDIEHKSSVWRNGEETNRKLTGISATNIKSNAIAMHSDAKKERSMQKKYKINGYYYGDNVAIIVGNNAKRGADAGEIVINDAKVVKIIKKR